MIGYKSNERSGLAWFCLGIWKLGGRRGHVEKGRCPLCNEEENLVSYITKMY
jgi:hypothetical protein